MTATAHALVGTVIAAKVGNPAIAIPLALGSHVIMDMIPHWDALTTRREKGRFLSFIDVCLDGAVALLGSAVLLFVFFPETNPLYALLIIFAALFEDFLSAPYIFLNWKFFPFYHFYRLTKLTDNTFNHGVKLNNIWGKLDQVAVVAGVILLAKLI